MLFSISVGELQRKNACNRCILKIDLGQMSIFWHLTLIFF